TGEVLSTEWSKNQDFKDVVSPDVTGYTPRVKTVSNKNVAHDAQNIDVVVIYDADAQKAKVAYIDDKTGQTIETKTLTGVSNAHSGYSTISTIKDLENKGYKLVSDDTTGSEIVFDNDDKTDQAYAVHLAHRTSVVTPNDPKNPVNGNDMTDDLTKKVHQTIKYVELSGKQAAKSNVQTLTFGRSATVDLVDGTVLSYTDWDGPKSTKAVKSPKVKGFVPDKKIVPAQSYKATDADKVITVAYKAVKKAVPAQTPKAPAKKPAIPVKAPKAVKTAEPAKTISIKESAQAQDQLPQTGEDNSKAAFGLGLASILGGIGILGAFKRKKKEN
ncbi:mucin-binding protein, partial [Lactobacillus delbrueckii]